MSQIRTTTLDYTILGLLLSGDKTAYAIRMIFKNTAMGNYSSSPGSIYPATHKLKKLGLVTGQTEGSGVLQITEAGKGRIKEWLTQPLTLEMVSKESHILILKFAFMDHLVSLEEKVAFLDSFQKLTATYLKSLEYYHQSSEGAQLPFHGRLSFEYGLANLKTQLAWIKSSLKAIRKGP